MAEFSEKAFKKKLEKITDNIINMFNEELHKRKESEKFITPRLVEIKQNIKEKEICASKMIKMIEELEHKKAELQTEVSALKIEVKQQKQLLNRLENNFNDKAKVVECNEQELITASQALGISAKDKEILEIDGQKLSIYKNLTNVIWDYTIPLHHSRIIGYVENSRHGYIQAFNYTSNKMTEAEITKKMWQEVEQGIAGDWKNLVQIKDKLEDLTKPAQENNT